MRHGPKGWRKLRLRVTALMREPVFIAFTVVGNLGIVIGAAAFYAAEGAVNPEIHSFLDCLTWSVGLATTVGSYIVPVTAFGKVLQMALMLWGALFLWTYMGMFASGLTTPELRRLENEIDKMESEFRDFERKLAVGSGTGGTDDVRRR